MIHQRSAIRLFTQRNLILASVRHAIGEFHVIVHRFVDLCCQHLYTISMLM